MDIQLLDSNVIRQLKSSLTITSLTQCVKELIQNALDAEATNVEILLDTEKFNIQVNDNGYGIQNLNKICQRHVTSKCHTLADMNQLKSFGYRGEALAAIVNESLTQIISRHYTSNETYEAFWRDGQLLGQVTFSKHTQKSQPGTSVIVRDLFYKYPVRRRKIITEYQHVVIIESVKRLVMNFSLCFPNLNFTLVNSNRNTKILVIRRTLSSLETFKQLFGQDAMKSLVVQEENIKVDGFFSIKSYPNKSCQFIFINNYNVPSNNELYKIVSDIFTSSNFMTITENDQISPGKFIKKYPMYLIKFVCDDWSSYEINMYLELFMEFSSYEKLITILKKYVKKLLTSSGYHITCEDLDSKRKKRRHSLTTKSNQSYTKDPYVSHSQSVNSSVINLPNSHISLFTNNDYLPWWDENSETMYYIDPKSGNSYTSEQLSQTQSLHIQNKIDRTHLKKAKIRHSNSDSNEKSLLKLTQNSINSLQLSSPLSSKLCKEDLLHVKVLGQADRKFIVVVKTQISQQSIVMIDQHAADERIKLEEMIKTMKSIYTLEPTIPIQVNSDEFQLLTSARIYNYFKLWGIHFNSSAISTSFQQSRFFSDATSSHFQPKQQDYKLYITKLPKHIIDRSVMNPNVLKEIICDHLYWILEQTDESIIMKTCPRGIMELLKSRACRSAIMFNDELSLDQCKSLVKKLAACSFPFQCAHGRPSTVPVNLDVNSSVNKKQKRMVNWSRFKL